MSKQVSPATLAAALQQARGEHLDTGPCTIEIADAAAIYRLLPDQPDALTFPAGPALPADVLRLVERMAWDHALSDRGGATTYTHFNQIAQAWINCDCHQLARRATFAAAGD